MAYRLELKPSAQKALVKIPPPHRQRIAKIIDRLRTNPRPRGSVKLAGIPELYRIRIGEYRVVYQVRDDVLVVLVVRISGRGDVYRNLP
jgi:mRNA interferase RelE/StbE